MSLENILWQMTSHTSSWTKTIYKQKVHFKEKDWGGGHHNSINKPWLLEAILPLEIPKINNKLKVEDLFKCFWSLATTTTLNGRQ